MTTNDQEKVTDNLSKTAAEQKRSLDEDKALYRLSKKVEKARALHSSGPEQPGPEQPGSAQQGRSSAIGLAYRLSIELVVGLVVGGYLGWWLDKFFGTKPLFLLIMLLLGMAAGVINMLRTAHAMNARMGLNDKTGTDESQN